MSTEIQKTKLPSLEEVYENESMTLPEKVGTLNVLLNQKPSDKWIKTVSGIKEIPVARLEWLMTFIFGRWHTEVVQTQFIANSICVTVRVHYFDSVSEMWRFTDGVGAVKIQIDKKEGLGAIDFQKMKPDAVHIGLPAAKAFAFKNAVKSLGNLFGKDINREDEISYESMLPEMFVSSEECSELDTLLQKTDKPFAEGLFSDFGIATYSELPKSQFKKFKSRILDRMTYGTANN